MPDRTPYPPHTRIGALCAQMRAEGIDPILIAACLSVQAGNMRAIAERQAEATRRAQVAA